MPFFVLLFIILAMLQKADNELNLSVVILESWPLHFLGYCSYPLCKCFTN